jgi:hypothetical protein
MCGRDAKMLKSRRAQPAVEMSIVKSSLVRPTAFYSGDAQKTKLNWFCYEYALEIVHFIDKGLQRRLNRKGVTDKRIVDFAVYFAKHMKVVAMQKLGGEFKAVPMNYQDIERFFPRVDDRLVDDLLTVVAKAWDSLLEVRSACPTRCISERDRLTPAFDVPNL